MISRKAFAPAHTLHKMKNSPLRSALCRVTRGNICTSFRFRVGKIFHSGFNAGLTGSSVGVVGQNVRGTVIAATS